MLLASNHPNGFEYITRPKFESSSICTSAQWQATNIREFKELYGFKLLQERYLHRAQLFNENVNHFSKCTNHETTPGIVFKDTYKYADFIKDKTADPFPPDKLWTKYFHYCGFTRHLSPQDIFINSPWDDEQAAFSILKALVLFEAGANVALLLQRKSYQDSPNRCMLDLFGKIIYEGYLAFGEHDKALPDPCYLICLR